MSTDSRACGVVIPVQRPADSIGIYKIDYRGGLQLAAGQIAHFTVTPAIGSVLGATFEGENKAISFCRNCRIGARQRAGLESDARFGSATIGRRLCRPRFGRCDHRRLRAVDFSQDIDRQACRGARLGRSPSRRYRRFAAWFPSTVQGENDASLLASGGSLIGATGHYAIDDGHSLLAGGAYFNQSVGGADASGFPLLAAALRYVQPEVQAIHLFAEGGILGAPDMNMHFSRQYQNRLGRVDSGGDASGTALGIYARAGIIYAPNAANEISFSGTVAQDWLRVGSYAEIRQCRNLFTARIGKGTSSTTICQGDCRVDECGFEHTRPNAFGGAWPNLRVRA